MDWRYRKVHVLHELTHESTYIYTSYTSYTSYTYVHTILNSYTYYLFKHMYFHTYVHTYQYLFSYILCSRSIVQSSKTFIEEKYNSDDSEGEDN